LHANSLKSLNLLAQHFCLIVVFVLYGQRFVHLKLAHFVLGIDVEKATLSWVGHRGARLLLACTLQRWLLLAHLTHRSLVHDVHLGWNDSGRRPNAIERNQTNLVVNVELVLVVLMEEHFQKG